MWQFSALAGQSRGLPILVTVGKDGLMTRLLPWPLLWIVAVSLLALAVLLWGTAQGLSPFYYGTMCLIGIWVYHGARGLALEDRLQNLPLPWLPRAILLGYLAVMGEETLVGTLFALNEGITPALWAERVSQFIAFNLLAFSGAIWGLAIMTRLLPGLCRWHLLIAGGWGIFAERSYLLFLGNPIAGALIAGPNIAVYSIILAPLVLSIPWHDSDGRGRRWWAPLAAWGLMLAISIPAVLVLITLRMAHPGWFPPCDYIACD